MPSPEELKKIKEMADKAKAYIAPTSEAAPEESKDDGDMLSKALLGLAPALLGAAIQGNQGGAIGGQVGASAIKSLQDQAEKEKDRKLQQDKVNKELGMLGETLRHNRATEDLGAQAEARKYEIEKGKLEKEKRKPLAAEQSDKLSGHEASFAMLNDLKSAIDANSDQMGPIQGRLTSMNPYNEKAQALQGLTKAAAQTIGKSMEGGKLTDADILRYEKMLPTLHDDPEIANKKIENLSRMISSRKKTDLDTYQKAGYDVKDFTPTEVPENSLLKKQPKEKGAINKLFSPREAQASEAKKPKTIIQNGHTYTLNPQTGEYE